MRDIIDFHCHVYPDNIAGKLISRMEEIYHVKRKHDATYQSLHNSMKKGNIGKAVVLAVANKPEHFKTNEWYAEISRKNDSIISFGSIHPRNNPQDLLKFKEWGLTGIKWQPNAQQFYPNDPKMKEFYRVASELGLIVIFHCGNEENNVFGQYAQPENFKLVLKKFPDLKVVLTHLGGYQTWHKLDNVLGYENTYYDTAHLPGNIPDNQFLDLIEKIGIDKVIFGTDFPWEDHLEQVAKVQKLLGKEADKILRANPERLLNHAVV